MMLMRKDVDKEQEEGGETGQRITGLGMGTPKQGLLICIVGVVLCRAEHLMNGCEECTYHQAEELAVMAEGDLQQRDDEGNTQHPISCFSDR